jgi:hypothetical protein
MYYGARGRDGSVDITVRPFRSVLLELLEAFLRVRIKFHVVLIAPTAIRFNVTLLKAKNMVRKSHVISK